MCTLACCSCLVTNNGRQLNKGTSPCQQMIYLLQKHNGPLLKVRLAQKFAVNASINATGTCGILHKHLSRTIL